MNLEEFVRTRVKDNIEQNMYYERIPGTDGKESYVSMVIDSLSNMQMLGLMAEFIERSKADTEVENTFSRPEVDYD